VPKQLVPPFAAPTAILQIHPGVTDVVATTYPAPPPAPPRHVQQWPEYLKPQPPPPKDVILTSETPVGIKKVPDDPKNLKAPVPKPGLTSLDPKETTGSIANDTYLPILYLVFYVRSNRERF
jgi:hypothetical protein